MPRRAGYVVAGLAGIIAVGSLSAAAGAQTALWLAHHASQVRDVRVNAHELVIPLDVRRGERAVAFSVDAPATLDRRAETISENPEVLEIIREGRLLAGEKVGYAWVRPVRAGEAIVRIGSERVRVNVIPGDAAAEAREMRPRILTPCEGAAVWGRFSVGVRAWRGPGEERVALRLGYTQINGEQTWLEPVWASAPSDGPVTLAAFDVDAGSLPRGVPARLRAVRIGADGREHEGGAVSVRAITPESADLTSGECEDDYGLMAPRQIGPPRAPRSDRDKDASGERFFSNNASDPRFRFPVNVPSERGPGWYQVVMRVSGDAAAGALPAIGVRIDEQERLATSAQIAQTRWHRVSVGTPVKLEPGLRVVRCDFANDFAIRGSDRNLRLDAIEVVRVADVDPREGSGGGSAGGDAMMMNGGGGERASDDQAMMMMMGGGDADSGTDTAGWPANADARLRPPVRIAFERPLDGLHVMGETEIRGVTAFDGQNARQPPSKGVPTVELVINGKRVASQRADAPRFVVPADWWTPGENTVLLRAAGPGGWTAATPTERVTIPSMGGAEPIAGSTRRESVRITIEDTGWFGLKRRDWRESQGGENKWSAPVANSSQIVLELPEELEGVFDLMLEGKAGNSAAGTVAVSLIAGSLDSASCPPAPFGLRTMPTWFGPHVIGSGAAGARGERGRGEGLVLSHGPKALLLASIPRNGKWEPGKGDKSALWLQAVRLIERASTPDITGPRIEILHPADGTEMFDADAVALRAFDAGRITIAEVVIDGRPSGIVFDASKQFGFGDMALPVSLRGLAPGEHTIGVRVVDGAGNESVSAVRRVNVPSAMPAHGTPYLRAVAALDRFGFGPDQRELAAILGEGMHAYLDRRLCAGSAEDGALLLGATRFPGSRSTYDVPRRVLQQAIATENPVRARFVLFAQNHFSTWMRKDEPYRKIDEHERFGAIGVGRFSELLRASATSPAMLRYLDQERSFAGRLNENYAREILELHTLGVRGGYTQADVTNLAHVLTGWTTARQALAGTGEDMDASPDDDGLVDAFSYEPRGAASLNTPRRTLGEEFGASPAESRHERVGRLLEMLSAHPSTARFVCHKIVGHYVGLPADDRLVEDLASVFSRTGGDMREVLLALAGHPVFIERAVSRGRLAHPLDYGVRLCRVAGWNAPWDVGDFLGASGQGLFDRATPDGYPEQDADSMDSNTLLQRWKLASKADWAIADLVPGPLRYADRDFDDADAQRVIDLIAIRLTGRTLGPDSNAAAMEMVKATTPDLPARPEDLNRDGRVRTLGAFIAQLPEAGVR